MLLARLGFALALVPPAWALPQGPDDGGFVNAPLTSTQLGAKGHGEAGQTTWSALLGYYDRDDAGGASGNPFLDETLTVIEPVYIYDSQVSEDFGYDIQFSYDRVSSASIERLSKFDGQSGATGDNYLGLDFGFRHKLSDATNVSWRVGGSVEYDYTSIGVGGGLSHTFEEADASLALNLDAFLDTVEVIRFDGSTEADENRNSVAATLGWYQVIDPKTHGEIGLTVSSQSGFLGTPYNAVVVLNPGDPPNPNLANNANGTEFTEEVPDSRTRLTLFGRARRRLGAQTALELGARVYDDDWGIQAYDFSPRLLYQLAGGSLIDVHYRFYTQTAADFFAPEFTALPAERTQDSDLGDFDSNLIGAQYSWGGAASNTWSVALDFLDRSDGLDHWFFSLGYKKSF